MTVSAQEYAANVRKLLDEDPKRYRNFGVYWFFIKALLKKFYDRNQMPILGPYIDPEVVAAMPQFETLEAALTAAAEEYGRNAVFNLGRSTVTAENGEEITIFDNDVGL